MLYDFTVCGAGPVGSYLAWKLAEMGHKTLLVEEHEKVGEPLACSGLISRNLFKFFEDKSIVEREINGARIHVGKKIHRFPSREAVVVDRTRLDKLLAKKAIKSGVEVANKTRLFSFLESKEKVSLYMKSDNFKNISTKVLAGCDGPLSAVRENMGIPKPSMLHGIFTYVDEEPDDQVDLYFKKAPGFFAWRIPRKSNVEYGIASDYGAKQYFKKFTDKMHLHYDRVYSGMIPYGLLRRTSSNRVFLCGDAASHVKPYSGGGVVYGLTAARIASVIIKPDKPDMDSYEKEWRRKLASEIRHGMTIKKSYSLPAFMLNRILNSVSKKKNLEMDKPSTIW